MAEPYTTPFTEFLVDKTTIDGVAGDYTIRIMHDAGRTLRINHDGEDPVYVYQARHPDNIIKPNVGSKMKTKKIGEASSTSSVVKDLMLKNLMELDEDFKMKKPMKPEEEEDENGKQQIAEDEEEIEDSYEHLYVKYACMDRQPKSVGSILREVDNNERIPDHENILGMLRKPFIDKGFYTLVFPFMNLGSLRSIMKRRSKFQYGFPEDLILVVLRETLKGLSVIHQNKQTHGEINAGHIFISDNPTPQIKLGFSASVFDLNEDVQAVYPLPNWYPRNAICDWASAPEVRHTGGLDYTDKSDVWLIGILAMELAYGEIRVNDRNALNSILAEISQTRRLPNKIGYQYLQVKSFKEKLKDGYKNMKGALEMKSWEVLKHDLKLTALSLGRGKAFSRGFSLLVAQCLASNPDNRPTVDKLLDQGIFNKLKTVVQFHDEVTN